MTVADDWDHILTLGAAIAEETRLRAKRPEDVPHILASAVAWTLLQAFWNGEASTVLRRWQDDIPGALSHYAERITLRKRGMSTP